MAEVKSKKAKKHSLTGYNRWGYVFIIPFVIVFCIFSLYPVFRTLYLSFNNYKGFGVPEWIGIKNYTRALTDKFFWKSFFNTWKIWGINIVLQLGLAFLLTIVFSDIKYKVKGLSIFRAVYYLPNIISCTSVAFLFKMLLDWQYGSFNRIIYNVSKAIHGYINGIPVYSGMSMIDWLNDSKTAFLVIAIISAWMWFGNSFIMLMASVQGIPVDYFEAAAIDGANRWVVFGKITLPLIRPILLYVAITSLIGGLQMFDMPYLMVSTTMASYPSVRTAMMYLYSFGFGSGVRQVGYASAIAYILFLFIFAISVAQFFLFNRKGD